MPNRDASVVGLVPLDPAANAKRKAAQPGRMVCNEGRGLSIVGRGLRPGDRKLGLLAEFVQANNAVRGFFEHHTMAKRKATRSIDRSPVTGTTSATSEEVLAVANDTAEASRRQPSHEEIAAVAYERYLNRGAAHGQDCDDWLAAERELSERHGR